MRAGTCCREGVRRPRGAPAPRLRPGRGLLPHEPLGRRVGDPRLRHLAGEGPRGGRGPQSRRRGGEARLERPALPVRRDGLGAQERRRGAPCLRAPAARAAAARLDLVGGHPDVDSPAWSGTECSSADVDGRNERARAALRPGHLLRAPVPLGGVGDRLRGGRGRRAAEHRDRRGRLGLPDRGRRARRGPRRRRRPARAMLWLADPAVAARMGAAARRRSERFTWEAVGRRLLRALAGAPPSDELERPRSRSATPRIRREHGAERRHVSSARGRPGQRRRRVRGLPERHPERLQAGGPPARGACARSARGCARRSPGWHPAPRRRRPRGGPPRRARSGRRARASRRRRHRSVSSQ